jgi:hypothetical protein
MAKAFDLAVTPWSPLGGGVLTGKYNQPPQTGGEQGRLKLWGEEFLRRISHRPSCQPSCSRNWPYTLTGSISLVTRPKWGDYSHHWRT